MRYEIHDGTVPEEIAESVAALCEEVFGDLNRHEFFWKLENQRAVGLIVCADDSQLVGFKLGYARNETKYYSWLGGVREAHRRRGVGRELMRRQHEWCADQGFTVVETHTLNRHRDMLILNLRSGFQIKGTLDSDVLGLKIVLEKRLGGVSGP